MERNGMHTSYDAVVVGGGPAGSTVSTFLARKGYRVLLLEKERFPRMHIGESLIPGGVSVLRELGLVPALEEAGFLVKLGASTVWGEDRSMWTFYFNEVEPEQNGGFAYQVWRPQFDEMLLNHSRNNGVEVLQPCRATQVLFEGDRAVGVEYGDAEQARHQVRARYVIDASGQDALLAQRLQTRQWDSFFQNIAVFAYFEGAERLPGIDRNNILIEAYENGWFWVIPLHTGWTSVGAVVDRRQFGARSQRNLVQFFNDQIAQTDHTARLLSGARRVTRPTALRDWSYLGSKFWGPGYLSIGDAACFIDPLFSTGVYLAMQSGMLAAAAIHAVEHDGAAPEDAFGYFEREYRADYESLRDVARFFYSGNRAARDSFFWNARKVLQTPDEVTPREAFIRLVSGKRRIGYERALLDHVALPEPLADELQKQDEGHADRLERFIPVLQNLDMVPRLRPEITIRRELALVGTELVEQPVLYKPDFENGYVTGQYGEVVLKYLDGERSLREIAQRVRLEGVPRGSAEDQQGVLGKVLNVLGALCIDGYAEVRSVGAPTR
jgi:flavin-dependent dehydrogenase